MVTNPEQYRSAEIVDIVEGTMTIRFLDDEGGFEHVELRFVTAFHTSHESGDPSPVYTELATSHRTLRLLLSIDDVKRTLNAWSDAHQPVIRTIVTETW